MAVRRPGSRRAEGLVVRIHQEAFGRRMRVVVRAEEVDMMIVGDPSGTVVGSVVVATLRTLAELRSLALL